LTHRCEHLSSAGGGLDVADADLQVALALFAAGMKVESELIVIGVAAAGGLSAASTPRDQLSGVSNGLCGNRSPWLPPWSAVR
jgi:hypothetical protein